MSTIIYLALNGADAVAAAYIFHFSKFTPNDIKKEMKNASIPVRK